eukprot:PhM_4_TR18826/c0_g3_i3/m.95725
MKKHRMSFGLADSTVELRDLVLRFLCKKYPTFLDNVEGEVPIASAQRALQVWSDITTKRNAAEVQDMADDIVNLRILKQASIVRSTGSSSKGSVSGCSKASMIKRMIEDVQPPDDNELDCESDECERAGLDVLRYDARGPHQPVHHTNRDLVPTAKANKDLLRRPVLPHTERVFDMLPLSRDSCSIPTLDIVMCERWIHHNDSLMCDAVRRFFLGAKNQERSKQVYQEIKDWTDRCLGRRVDEVFRVYRRFGYYSESFAETCENVDIEIKEMMRKKILIEHGVRKAEAFVYECSAQDPRYPDWYRVACAVQARENKDFRGPTQEATTGGAGPKVANNNNNNNGNAGGGRRGGNQGARGNVNNANSNNNNNRQTPSPQAQAPAQN